MMAPPLNTNQSKNHTGINLVCTKANENVQPPDAIVPYKNYNSCLKVNPATIGATLKRPSAPFHKMAFPFAVQHDSHVG